MFSAKLIAPLLGVIAVPCSVGLSGATDAESAPAGAVPSTSTQLVLASEVAHPNVLVGHVDQVAGWVAPTLVTQVVRLQERAARRWVDIGAAETVAGGGFTLHFRPRRIGSFALRVQASGADGTSDASSARLEVYHEVLASWYGPGGRTACGEDLTARTLGVANKTLPCGTVVTLHYGNRTLRVPVIDRGPYVAGRDYDLTYATKRALHAGDLTVLWASR